MRQKIRVRTLAIILIVSLLSAFIVNAVIDPYPLYPLLSSARSILSSARSTLSSVTPDRSDPPTAVLLYKGTSDPFEESPPDWESTQRHFQTMVQIINSPRILSEVLLDPDIASLSFIRNAKNPEQLLRDHIEIRRPNENAPLIEISAPGFPRVESVTIVNGFVEKFIEFQDDLANAIMHRTIEELENINADLEAELQEHLERLTDLDQIPLEPDGPTLSRAEIEAALRTCLEHLRRVQLDRAALPTNAEEDALAPLDRQMDMLVAERDRLTAAITRANGSESERLLRQHSIDNLLETRNQIQKSFMRAKFHSNSALHSNSAFRWTSADLRWIVVSKAQ